MHNELEARFNVGPRVWAEVDPALQVRSTYDCRSKGTNEQLFICGSDLVKTDCWNAMILGDMKISHFKAHTQQVKGNKLREMAKDKKKARTSNYEYSTQKLGGGNHSQFQ